MAEPVGEDEGLLCQRVDVADAAAVEDAFDALESRGIRLDTLVLNAGLGRWTPLAELAEADWRRTLAVNLDGAFHVLKRGLSLIEAAPAPLVVGILSDSALHHFADRAAYSASKAGLRALLETARLEARARGVRFSLLYPSRVDTHFAGSVPEGRPGLRPGGLDPAEVAEVVAFLLAQPPRVEIRELHLSALTERFGPYQQKMEES